MCGRISLHSYKELVTLPLVSKINPDTFKGVDDQATPGSLVPVITKAHTLGMMLWGFSGGQIYNTRVESLDTKQFWLPHKDHHVVIPIDRFYEGRTWFRPQEIMYGAAIYHHDSTTGYEVSLLTEPANENVQRFHPRQPVMLKQNKAEEWLQHSIESPF